MCTLKGGEGKENERSGEFVGFRELALLVVVLVRRLAGYAFPASVTRGAHLRHAGCSVVARDA